MGQAFYEIDSNFLPVYNLAVALIKERGRDDICRVLLDARLSVLNTEFDGWNGGTYGYTVFVSLSVKQYTSFSTEKREEMEKVLSDALNESINGDNNNYFHVQIGPFLSKDDVDWNLIGGLNGKATLKQDVETIRNIMISVATGGNRIQDEDKRYKELHIRALRNCKKLNLIYNNTYSSLWDWYGKWKAEFATYQERRDYIRNLFEPTLSYFEEKGNNNPIDTIIELDDWDRIKRTITKIKRDSDIAKNEEDFQSIGLLCREVIISLAQVVYIPWLHGDKDDKGVSISETDAVRMIGNYLNYSLSGSSNEELRSYAKNANKLANMLTHKRNATKKDMLLAVSATISLINFIGIIEEKY